jgi:predicted PurR-regulated permease PerM
VVAAGYVLYHQLEVGVLVPRIFGSTMKLSGSVILISNLIGGKLMGVVGALLALPVAAAVPVVLQYVGQWRDRQADRLRPAAPP